MALAVDLDSPQVLRCLNERAQAGSASYRRGSLMDGYQWILTAAAHVERHTKQMLEVRADPNFPTK